jgi:membrane-bound serine protease (ClpP class)
MDPSLTLAYLLIVVGLLLLVLEVFLPSGGLMMVLSFLALAIGVGLTFVYAEDTRTGVVTLVALLVIVPVMTMVLLYYWPRTRMGKRFILPGPEEDATLASMPTNLELEHLRGQYGKTVSALRPAGITDFGGKYVDTITEGFMVEPGQWVRCIDVRAGKVIVRPANEPKLSDLEDADFGP